MAGRKRKRRRRTRERPPLWLIIVAVVLILAFMARRVAAEPAAEAVRAGPGDAPPELLFS